ncbi:EthD domain-containing protein [Mycobacterium sp. MYCO198283]|uniref:EthD domain-containing protein n=1 Tax=Mycobacterium sp. MYCO198283 TaxID=2883505 RepID=UPI001E5F1115|nr:EthD domain-containing protein [Mycobacterium sp. MYCO198283]MCG5430907.1 EthD domain-containing protein [Mycobacterium sp. MYCO198283]
MEKVILLVRDTPRDDAWCDAVRTTVAADILALGVAGLAVNVRDGAVRDAVIAMTTLDPPVQAVIGIWTQQHYGPQVAGAVEVLRSVARAVDGYLVTESAPLPPPATDAGTRTDGLANIALLRRPVDLDDQTWRARWHLDHTPVAIETQATFGYTQNAVVRPLTADAPPIDGIVEELFPHQAVSDLHAFFGAADDADLSRRLERMVASTARFGANDNIDTIPTSRYLLRSPFAS